MICWRACGNGCCGLASGVCFGLCYVALLRAVFCGYYCCVGLDLLWGGVAYYSSGGLIATAGLLCVITFLGCWLIALVWLLFSIWL